MCGRFTAKNPNLIKKRFEEFDLHGPSLPARYNIGPAQLLMVIALDEQGKAVAKEMRWGFIPSWAIHKAKAFKPRANVRAEPLDSMFKSSLQKRRCLIPADGMYEWKKLGENFKQPHHIQLKGGEPFFFAGIYEQAGNERPDTVALFTTRPNSLVEKIHDRMAVILQGEAAHAWLRSGPLSPEEFSRLSAPFPAEEMVAWPVSDAVNSVRNEGPILVEPVPEKTGPTAAKMIAERPGGEQLTLL